MTINNKLTMTAFCTVLALSVTACESMQPAHQHRAHVSSEADLVVGAQQILTIAPIKIACDSALPMQCMLAKTEDNQIFQIPYNWIEGFAAQTGQTYQIKARPIINSVLQQPTGKWQLDSIESQKAVN